jgi:hypothetical protein
VTNVLLLVKADRDENCIRDESLDRELHGPMFGDNYFSPRGKVVVAIQAKVCRATWVVQQTPARMRINLHGHPVRSLISGICLAGPKSICCLDELDTACAVLVGNDGPTAK